MQLLEKYKSKGYKTFSSINQEGVYYHFLARWQERTDLQTRLLEYTENKETGGIYMVARCTVGNQRFLLEVQCNLKEVSFAIIGNRNTNINSIIKKGFNV